MDASCRPDRCKHWSPGHSYTDSTPPKFVKDDYSDSVEGWRIPDSQAASREKWMVLGQRIPALWIPAPCNIRGACLDKY